MDAARWETMQALFHEAVDLPEAQRLAFLEAECGNDPGMVADVLALLESDAGGGSLLDRDLADVARDVLDESNPVLPTIGRYRVRKVLGEGGMGVVYLGEREDLEQRVAIKVLRDASLSPARRERFALEERLLAHLEHPSIARLYDADTLPGGTPYFVMEYVEGVPLTTYCETHGCSIPERLRLFRGVCEAVQYAHRQAVIHRDLKPSNILVTGAGEVKLLDFGIAKQLEGLETPAEQTRTWLRLMTPAYAAPEQLRGEAVGVYTDVYALGVILYELLAGRPPFDLAGKTPGEMEKLVLSHEPERASARARRAGVRPPAPPRPASPGKRGWRDLDVLCLTAMHKEAQRRYPTVEALVRDLDRFLTEKPLEARPDSWSYRTGKFLRRNRRPVATAALVAVVLFGLVGFYTVRLAAARDTALAEAEKAEQVSEYLISLFEASDPFGANHDSLDVRTLLRRGVERADELAARPAVQAQMLDVLGRVYTRLSQYDAAEPLLRQALTLRRRGDDPADLAESLVSLGQLYALMGRPDSATVRLHDALVLRERQLSPDHPDVAVVLNDLGDLLTTEGEYEQADSLYRRALRIQRHAYAEPHEELAHTLNNLGVNFFNQGKPDSAEPFYREALAVYREVFGPDHPNVATGLANLGIVRQAKGDYAAAESLLTEALRIRRRTLGTDHFQTAFGLTSLGALLRTMKEYDRAEGYLREAVAINERLLGQEHLNTAVTRQVLAWTLRDEGDYAAAESLFRRVLPVFRENVGEHHYYTGSALCNLANVLRLQAEREAAEPLYRECLPILEDVLPAGHPSLMVQKRGFGELLAAQSRFAEAEPLLVESYESLYARRGAGHDDTRAAAQRLIELYEAWDRPEEAMIYRRALAASAGASPSP